MDPCGLASSSRSPAGRLHCLVEWVLLLRRRWGRRRGVGLGRFRSRFGRLSPTKDVCQESPSVAPGAPWAAGRSRHPVPLQLTFFLPPSNLGRRFWAHSARNDGPGVIFGVENVFFLQRFRNSVGPPHRVAGCQCGAKTLSRGCLTDRPGMTTLVFEATSERRRAVRAVPRPVGSDTCDLARYPEIVGRAPFSEPGRFNWYRPHGHDSNDRRAGPPPSLCPSVSSGSPVPPRSRREPVPRHGMRAAPSWKKAG